jgi:alpha-amylase/alpha-mannosidase (GH57 family)
VTTFSGGERLGGIARRPPVCAPGVWLGEVKTVTVSEYLDGNRARRLPAHPAREQTRVYELFTGSWIDEWDSAPGADLGTWIGEPEENAAGELLGAVRTSLEQTGRTRESHPDAFRALYGAEAATIVVRRGSPVNADEAFDDFSRAHRGVCRSRRSRLPAS